VNGWRGSAPPTRTPPPRDDVDVQIVERRIQALLDDRVQAMDLVDEEDVVLLQLRREERRERALVLDDRPAGGRQLHAHLVGQDVSERRLAEPRRPREKDVVERLARIFAAATNTLRFSVCFFCPT